jgi:hypothetical protein
MRLPVDDQRYVLWPQIRDGLSAKCHPHVHQHEVDARVDRKA